MKTKLLLSLLLAIYGMAALAQTEQMEYRPFAKEGKTWEAQVGPILENNYCNSVDGDTLIGGESWKKVYNYIAFPDFNYSYYAAIRDVGNTSKLLNY